MPKNSSRNSPKRRGTAKPSSTITGLPVGPGLSRGNTFHSLAAERKTLETNAIGYVASLRDPWNVRGMRIPESAPFPSTVGCSVSRGTLAGVDDSKGLPYRVSGACFGLDLCDEGVWRADVKAYDHVAQTVIWDLYEHPHLVEFVNNFQLIRTVSKGVKVVNVSTLLDRGGTIYVSYSAQRINHTGPSGNIFTYLKQAAETEIYDAARMKQDGIRAIYVPLTNYPMNTVADTITLPGSSYANPGATHTTEVIHDVAIYIWCEGSTSQDITLEWEEVHNWEAIPFTQNEFMFNRQAVMSSDDAKAAAMASMPPSSAISTTSDGGFWGSVKSTASNVGKFALKQLESVAMGALMGLPGLLMADDVRHHRLAWNLGLRHLSPMKDTKLLGISDQAFRALVAEELVKRPSSPPVPRWEVVEPPTPPSRPALIAHRTQ